MTALVAFTIATACWSLHVAKWGLRTTETGPLSVRKISTLKMNTK